MSDGKKNLVRNTQSKEEMEAFKVEALALGMMGVRTGSESIDRQEARGTEQLAGSDLLPVDMSGRNRDWESEDVLKKMGFELGDVVPDDELFRYAKFPEGWAKEVQSRLWSSVKDDQGRVRLMIGYKAAFYDRWARLVFKRRYDFSDLGDECVFPEGVDFWSPTKIRAVVMDCGKVVKHSGWFDVAGLDQKALSRVRSGVACLAQAWIQTKLPEYRHPLAYWDEPLFDGEVDLSEVHFKGMYREEVQAAIYAMSFLEGVSAVSVSLEEV